MRKNRACQRVKIYIGIFLIFFAFVLNPLFIEQLFSPDKNLDKKNLLKIILFEGTLILFGLFLIYIKKIPKNHIINFALLIGTIIVFIVTFEIALRVHPLILGDNFANLVLSKYNTNKDGMYENDANVNMWFMKPNFTTIAYYNRYKWLHKTDKWGFRNPVNKDRADIILLGDSFVYGHGVNQNQTIAYFLEENTNYSVMNLARQGDSAFQQMYILNQYGLEFEPEYVLYFFFKNDIDDLTYYLSKEEMKKFIETPIENITFKERGPRNKIKEKLFDESPYIFKIKYILVSSKNSSKKLDKKLSNDENSLEWNYTKKAFLQMNYVSKLTDAKLIIIPVTQDYPKQIEILRNFLLQHNISFIDARSMNEKDIYYLPFDGHYSEEGNKAMADTIKRYLLSK